MKQNKKSTIGIKRSEFLKLGAAGALFTGCVSLSRNETDHIESQAKNVIFLIVDGMSTGTLSNTDMTMRRKEGRVSNWVNLYDQNISRRALMDVAPLDAIVTDSAASGSAMGCGHSVPVRKINMGPDGEVYEPILTKAKKAGKSTGLVTTTRLSHATPASFAANVDHRREEDTIVEQYLKIGHDVYLGGGNRHFSSRYRDDKKNMYHLFASEGYLVSRTRDELFDNVNRLSEFDVKQEKLLGVFSRSHLPFSLDRKNVGNLEEEIPSLSEMTKIAIDHLSKNENGFIVQVEGGRVDHSAHGNNIGGLIYDQIEFDNAIGVALEFYESNPDTLIVITTDHGNASPTLNRSQNGYDETENEFDKIQHFKYTNEWILNRLNESSNISEIKDRVEEATYIGIETVEAELLQLALKGEYRAPYKMMSEPDTTLGGILANYLSINWTGTTHTGDYVELAALGPGSEQVGGFMKNSDLFHVMTNAMGLTETVIRP